MSMNDAGAGIDRRVFVSDLLRHCSEALVITGLGSPTYDVYAAGDRPQNFYLWGAMGGAATMGLGLALAQPNRSVLVITGDGEQLMGLGALATIGAQRPSNLSVVVLDNGHFGETGMQRSHTSLGTDLVAVAKGFGIPNSFAVESIERCGEVADHSAAHNAETSDLLTVLCDNQLPALLHYWSQELRVHVGEDSMAGFP